MELAGIGALERAAPAKAVTTNTSRKQSILPAVADTEATHIIATLSILSPV